MRHARRFASRLLNRPQLIEPGAAAAVVAALLPGAEIMAYAGPVEPVERDARDYQVTTSATAIIPVVGELVHRGAGMDAMSGVTSYQALQDMMSDALADPGITGVLLDVDSPGGEADGVLDFSEWLAAQRGTKPIWASVNLTACSAAYAIASAADRVLLAGNDARAGSIGVLAVHTDLSAGLAKQGAKLTFIYAGEHKIDGNSAQPLPVAVRDEWQAKVDALYDRFCSVVAANRGLTVEQVRATEARIFHGTDAVTAGLADDIVSQEDALMALTQRRAAPGARMIASPAAATVAMSQSPQPPAPTPTQPAAPDVQPNPPLLPGGLPTEQDLGDLPAEEADKLPRRNTPASPVPAPPKALADACAAAGFPELIAPLLGQGASMADVTRRIAEAGAIREACAQAGLPAMAAPMIEGGMPLASARRAVFAARAGSDAAIRTDSAHRGGTGATPAAAPRVSMQADIEAMDRFNQSRRRA